MSTKDPGLQLLERKVDPSDGIRKEFAAEKFMLEALSGRQAVMEVLARLRISGFKIPRCGDSEPDGYYPGFDADADLGYQADRCNFIVRQAKPRKEWNNLKPFVGTRRGNQLPPGKAGQPSGSESCVAVR
jgi:hypothetical protein